MSRGKKYITRKRRDKMRKRCDETRSRQEKVKQEERRQDVRKSLRRI